MNYQESVRSFLFCFLDAVLFKVMSQKRPFLSSLVQFSQIIMNFDTFMPTI